MCATVLLCVVSNADIQTRDSFVFIVYEMTIVRTRQQNFEND